MTHATNPTQMSPPPVAPNPPAAHANTTGFPQAHGVNANVVDPNAAPTEEIEAATFRTPDEADRTVADLVAAGVARENILVLPGRDEKRKFMNQYVHRDGDRHSHGGVAPAFFGVFGAVIGGVMGAAAVSQLALGTTAVLIATAAGAVIGAALAAITAGFAFRTADDKSVEIVEAVAAHGTLVAVRRPFGSGPVTLEEAGRVLSRNNGMALRLHRQVTQADMHPGDLRPDQM